MSPLNQRRLNRFKKDRRAIISFWLFSLLFMASLFSELIANDKPLLVKYESHFFVPFLKAYSETEFGGDFETEADYKDPYVIDLIEAKGWIIWPVIRFDYSTINYDLPTPAPSPPDQTNWLGTDDNGRDVVARILYGFRISCLFGFTLTIISALIGVIAGALQGFHGGKLDLFFQRFIEVWGSMPTLFILIILASVVQPSFWMLMGFLLLFSWMGFVGVVRAEFLRTRNFEYVLAAKALGMSNNRIMFKHVLPNAMVATLTLMPFVLSGSVTTLTSLDFLGFGLPPGSPSLGELLAQGKANIQAPWLGLSAFFVIGLLMALLVFIGEGVRNAFDPRHTD